MASLDGYEFALQVLAYGMGPAFFNMVSHILVLLWYFLLTKQLDGGMLCYLTCQFPVAMPQGALTGQSDTAWGGVVWESLWQVSEVQLETEWSNILAFRSVFSGC